MVCLMRGTQQCSATAYCRVLRTAVLLCVACARQSLSVMLFVVLRYGTLVAENQLLLFCLRFNFMF